MTDIRTRTTHGLTIVQRSIMIWHVLCCQNVCMEPFYIVYRKPYLIVLEQLGRVSMSSQGNQAYLDPA